MRSVHLCRVCSYTQETGTCRRLATSWTVSRRFSSLVSVLVAPFADSMVGRAIISTGKIASGNDCAFPCDSFDVPWEMKSVGRTARREECCLEDAVISGLSNWVGRDFIFGAQSSYEHLLLRGGVVFVTSSSVVHYNLHYKLLGPTLDTGETRSRVARGGLERPHEVLASRRRPKQGRSSPAGCFAPGQNPPSRHWQPLCSEGFPEISG